MESKKYRLDEFLPGSGNAGLLVDTSAGLSLGTLPGLESIEQALQSVIQETDGVIVSPGQISLLGRRTRQQAAILLRSDWTNALRDEEFMLPPEEISRINILTPGDALDMGASGVVVSFLLGYEEQIEADCMKTTVQFALEGNKTGMPVIVEVLPTGSRIVLFGKAVELGVSYALEGGGDGIAIPWPGADSFQTILKMASGVPIWIKPSMDQAGLRSLKLAIESGATGAWLGHNLFGFPEKMKLLKTIREIRGQAKTVGDEL